MRCLLVLAAVLVATAANAPPSKVICYYDSRSYVRESQARMLPSDLDPALTFCTHLVYGYAGIQPDTFKLVPLNENLDVDSAHQNYRTILNFRAKYPNLKVLLSVGGDVDTEEPDKYNHLLESASARTAFINSGLVLIEQYGFDGIDLAWQFPRIKPKKIRSAIGSVWHSIKKTFGSTPVDPKEAEHRDGFTALVRELRQALNLKPNRQLAVTVLPNVNATIYFDAPALSNLIDVVNLEAFDFATPERNREEADYAAPTYVALNRSPLLNVDAAVNYWLSSGVLGIKITIGISPVARTWKLDSKSETSGVPPIHADGPGEEGPYTKTDGLLSYPEVCARLINPTQHGLRPLRKVADGKNRFGTYAFSLPEGSEEGLWVSYEDPDTASQKAIYAKSKNLGGVSIVDLSMDDFRGLCTGDKYPILRAAKYRL